MPIDLLSAQVARQSFISMIRPRPRPVQARPSRPANQELFIHGPRSRHFPLLCAQAFIGGESRSRSQTLIEWLFVFGEPIA